MKIQKDKLRVIIEAKKAELVKEAEKAEKQRLLEGAAWVAAGVKWAKKVAALKAPTQDAIEAIRIPYKQGQCTYEFQVGGPYYHHGYYNSHNIEQCDSDLAMLDLIDGDSVTVSASRYGQWRNYLP